MQKRLKAEKVSDSFSSSGARDRYLSYACWYREAVRIETTIDTMQQIRKSEYQRRIGVPQSEEIATADNATMQTVEET